MLESILDDLAQWRHADIWRRLPLRSRPRPDPREGFLSPEKAAAVMGVSLAEVHEMAARGQLEVDSERRLIRPAVVSVLGVRTG